MSAKDKKEKLRKAYRNDKQTPLEMRLNYAAQLAILAASRASTAWKFAPEKQFRQALQNEFTLVAFVQPDLASSKVLEPEWTAVEKAVDQSQVVSIDCASQAKLCDEYDVASYPAVRLLGRDGRTTRYRGPRRAADITAFLRRSSRPVLSRVSEGNMTTFYSEDDIVFVASLAARDTVAEDRFQALARKYHDRFSFALGPSSSKPPSTIHCVNNQEQAEHTFAEFSTVAALEDFVRKCSAPIVVELTRRNELQVLNAGKSLVSFFYLTGKERASYIQAMRPLAKKYQEYLTFATVDATEYAEMYETLGLAYARAPLVVQNPGTGAVYHYAGPPAISPPSVEQFLVQIIQGAVQPWSGAKASREEAAAAGHDEL